MSKAKLSSKGQLTIPVNIREALGLKRGDVLSVELRDDGIFLRAPVTASSLMGTLPPRKKLPWKKARELAWRARVEEIMRRSSATQTSSSDS